MPYDRPLFKAFTATIVVNLSHLSVEIITFKNKITTGKKISIEKKIPIEYLEFSTRILYSLKKFFFQKDLNNTPLGF